MLFVKKFKGKRICRLSNNEGICPSCCALTRRSECEGCLYYQVSEKYHSSKQQGSGNNHFFIAEINEEVEKEADHALELIEKGSYQKGKAIIQGLMKDHPRNHAVNFAMGVTFLVKEQFDEAIKYFDKATDIFPYFIEAHFNKAAAYQKKLDIKNMIKAYQKVIELGNPKDELVKKAKNLLFDLEKSTLKSEGINLESHLKAMDHFDNGFSLMQNQEWEKAIFSFKECLTIHKRHPQSYGNMGICYSQLGQKKLALEAFDKALEIDPHYEPALVNRKIVRSLQDDPKLPSGQIESINYYRDYAFKKKSFIQSIFLKVKGIGKD